MIGHPVALDKNSACVSFPHPGFPTKNIVRVFMLFIFL